MKVNNRLIKQHFARRYKTAKFRNNFYLEKGVLIEKRKIWWLSLIVIRAPFLVIIMTIVAIVEGFKGLSEPHGFLTVRKDNLNEEQIALLSK